MSEVMKVEFEIYMPEKLWIAILSKKYHNINFEILSILPTEKMVGNALIKISGPDIENVIKEIKGQSSCLELYIIDDSDDSKIFNVKTNDPWLLISLIKSEIILEMPVIVKNGIAVWKVLAPRKKIATFNKLLNEKNVQFKLKSITKYQKEVKLTKRQSEILDLALKLGYYEIPRKITLTKLAKKLNIAKSTLSGIIRRIDKKLIELETSS
ncbi:MAG: helix-turn-helix domain-containing protein [Promethearchaeota archaeon]